MKKKFVLIGVITGCVILLGIIVAVFFVTRPKPSDGFTLHVYYFNPGAFRLESIAHTLPHGDEALWTDTAVTLFVNSSRIPYMTGVWTDEDERFLAEWRMSGDVLEAVFPREYHDIPAAFVWTMTGLPSINRVAIRVEGDDPEARIVLESRETVAINPVISSVRLTTRTFTLYFVNDTHDALVPVEYTSSTVDMDQVERYIISLLMEGTEQEGVLATIPSETNIIDIITEESICYVNLSSDFVNRFTGSSAMAQLMLYSIVNSLVDNMGHVRRVQFLIDSERVDQFQGLTDFHQVFERNEALIWGYAE
jgi:germination protein M